MELSKALENIKAPKHRIADAEINCIRNNKEESIPVLLEYVKTVIDLGEENLPEDYNAHFYSMYLLAEFKEKDALHPIRLNNTPPTISTKPDVRQ